MGSLIGLYEIYIYVNIEGWLYVYSIGPSERYINRNLDSLNGIFQRQNCTRQDLWFTQWNVTGTKRWNCTGIYI